MVSTADQFLELRRERREKDADGVLSLDGHDVRLPANGIAPRPQRGTGFVSEGEQTHQRPRTAPRAPSRS
jgi:hypothetical protein